MIYKINDATLLTSSRFNGYRIQDLSLFRMSKVISRTQPNHVIKMPLLQVLSHDATRRRRIS